LLVRAGRAQDDRHARGQAPPQGPRHRQDGPCRRPRALRSQDGARRGDVPGSPPPSRGNSLRHRQRPGRGGRPALPRRSRRARPDALTPWAAPSGAVHESSSGWSSAVGSSSATGPPLSPAALTCLTAASPPTRLLGAYYVDGEIVMVRRVCLLVLAGLAMAAPVASRSSTVIVSTTTSTQDSGLLDVLVPMFEKKSGMSVKTISVGTGQALALAARGEADVTLAHAPEPERRYVAEGKMLNRRLVMYNDFVIIGPEDDPARIKGMTKAVEALKRIAETQSRFVSRGDKSGTHILEQGLWKQAGIEPRGA